jgi:hypothetical protein
MMKLGALALALLAAPAAAQVPDAATLLADVGFTAEQIAEVEAGKFVQGKSQPSTERELAAAFAFQIAVPPRTLVEQLRTDLLDRTDPNTLAFAMMKSPPGADAFAKLSLQPDAQKRAQAYVSARPGGDLNLSASEISRFAALGSGASVEAVEAAVRSALLARLEAYQARGLAGIEPYARSSGAPRAPAEELRAATQATKRLRELMPAAYAYLLETPAKKPPGTEETFRWSHQTAHGVPTISLTHGLFVPDGDAYVAAQRQFYVSSGYNCEQAIAALLPMKGGTLVLYTNRTSTDQVSGFGGGAKRSLGSKVLASQLEELFRKVQAAERP